MAETTRVVARIERVASGEGIEIAGFDDDGMAFVFQGDRFTIGRHRSCQLVVTARDGRSVLGGGRSYVVSERAGRWSIVHTGHIGTFTVDGALSNEGEIELKSGSIVELRDCDTRTIALSFRFLSSGTSAMRGRW